MASNHGCPLYLDRSGFGANGQLAAEDFTVLILWFSTVHVDTVRSRDGVAKAHFMHAGIEVEEF